MDVTCLPYFPIPWLTVHGSITYTHNLPLHLLLHYMSLEPHRSAMWCCAHPRGLTLTCTCSIPSHGQFHVTCIALDSIDNACHVIAYFYSPLKPYFTLSATTRLLVGIMELSLALTASTHRGLSNDTSLMSLALFV